MMTSEMATTADYKGHCKTLCRLVTVFGQRMKIQLKVQI